MNNGQVNASARFIRLFIGEQGKFALPISIYSGVSANNFQTQGSVQRSNDILFVNLINPLSGVANLSLDGAMFFIIDTVKITKPALLYHVGERILTGIKAGSNTDPATGRPINFFNTYGSLGFYLQTGAWDRNNSRNIGLSWLALRYIGCYSDPKQLKDFIPNIQTKGIYHGYSIAWGVEINNLINLKVVYYKYVKGPEIDYSLPIYQFSFNYSLMK